MLVAVVLVSAAHVGFGATLPATALTLGLYVAHHAHSVSLVAEEGHVHLVLSHEERGHPGRAAAEHHGSRATSTSESDHVFHLTDDATSTAPRRAGVVPPPTLAAAVEVSPAPIPQWVVRPPAESRARRSDSLRTVVLRF